MLNYCRGAKHPDVVTSGKQQDAYCLSRKVWPLSERSVLPLSGGKYLWSHSNSIALSSVNLFSPSLKAKQRAEVLQSTQRFFSEQQQQQQNKPIGGKAPKVEENGSKPSEAIADSPGVCQDKAEEKPSPAPAATPKPVRTGPIKPQAIKTEETKS